MTAYQLSAHCFCPTPLSLFRLWSSFAAEPTWISQMLEHQNFNLRIQGSSPCSGVFLLIRSKKMLSVGPLILCSQALSEICSFSEKLVWYRNSIDKDRKNPRVTKRTHGISKEHKVHTSVIWPTWHECEIKDKPKNSFYHSPIRLLNPRLTVEQLQWSMAIWYLHIPVLCAIWLMAFHILSIFPL